MRRRNHRVLTVVLALAMTICMSAAAAAQKTTITFGVPWGLDVFEGVLLELVDAYNAKSQTVHVQIETGWGPEKLLTAAAGGTGPDVVGLDNPEPSAVSVK